MASIKDIHYYDDIIDLPYIKSKRHPPMSRLDRAAQFAPFSALTGHKEAIDETQRITDKKRILDENQIDIINQKLSDIMLNIKEHPQVSITYFQSDMKKSGGKYVTYTGQVKKIDEYHKMIIMLDKTKISIKDIYQID